MPNGCWALTRPRVFKSSRGAAGGGKSFTQARVENLLMAADGTTCVGVRVNGVDVRSKIVVSGIGAHRSYEQLVKPLKDPYLQSAASAAMARIDATTELTVSFIFLFIGLDFKADHGAEAILLPCRQFMTFVAGQPGIVNLPYQLIFFQRLRNGPGAALVLLEPDAECS